MPAFDYMIQPQGPNVDENLFINASNAGINAGKAQPTKTTAMIQGALQGIGDSLNMVEQGQRIQQNQNTIEQMPVQNARQQEALENDQIQNELGQLQLSITKDTNDLKLDATREQLMTQASALKEKRNLIEKKKTFIDMYSKAPSPLEKKELLASGQFNDVFAAEPNLYKQAVGPIYQYLSDDEKDATNLAFGKATIKNKYDAEAAKRKQAFEKAAVELESNPFITVAAVNADIPKGQIPYQSKIIKDGMYEVDPTTNKIKRDPSTGQFMQSKNFDPNATTKYGLIVGDKVVASGLGDKDIQAMKNFKYEQGFQNGSHRDRDIGNLVRSVAAERASRAEKAARGKQPVQNFFSGGMAAQKQVQPTTALPANAATEQPVEQAPAAAPEMQAPAQQGRVDLSQNYTGQSIPQAAKTNQPVKPRPDAIPELKNISLVSSTGKLDLQRQPVYEGVRQVLGLPEAAFKEVQPNLYNILGVVQSVPLGKPGMYSDEQKRTLEENKERVINTVAREEFRSNPKISEKFNDEAVASHNNMVDEFTTLLRSPGNVIGSGALNNVVQYATQFKGLDLNSLIKVRSPEELYTVKRYSFYNDLMDRTIRTIQDNAVQAKVAVVKRGNLSSTLSQIGNKK